MSTARDIMSGTAECAQTGETLVEAAKRCATSTSAPLPICGDDNRLKGMITDRDIVVDCIAEGSDPTSTTVEKFCGDKPVTIIGTGQQLEPHRRRERYL